MKRWKKRTQCVNAKYPTTSRRHCHRAWAKVYGPVTDPELQLLHKCNNPACVNVDHMYLGSRSDNQLDAVYSGTHNTQKLMPEDVQWIREQYAAGNYNQYELADIVGVGQPAISQIILRKSWWHLP